MGPKKMQANAPVRAEGPGRDRAGMQLRWWWPLLTLHSEYGGLEFALPATPFPEDRAA